MREVMDDLLRWWEAGETVGVGTVVATFQSAPRPPGASMLVGPGGEAVGSVSGGCVEGAVYELGQEVVESGTPVLQRYGVSDEDAFAVGLTCGGILDVYVEKVNRETFPELGEVIADIRAGRPVALATVVEHPDPTWVGRRVVLRPEGEPSGSLGSDRADDAVRDDVGPAGLELVGDDVAQGDLADVGGLHHDEGARRVLRHHRPREHGVRLRAADERHDHDDDREKRDEGEHGPGQPGQQHPRYRDALVGGATSAGAGCRGR